MDDLPRVEEIVSDQSVFTTAVADYDVTNEEFVLDAELRAINGFRVFVCTVGVLGNLIVITMILLLTEFKKGITHWYILQLAIADSAFLLTLPFQIVEDVNNEWIFPDGMCKAKEAILFINYYSSIAFLMVMAVDRYIAICHAFSDRLQKLRTQKAAYIITAVVWIIAVLICIPIMMYSTKRGQEPYCKCELQFPEPMKSPHEICVSEGMGPDVDLGSGFSYEDCLNLFANQESEPACAEPSFSDYEQSGNGSIAESEDTLHPGCHYINYNKGFIGFLYFNFIIMFIVPFIIIAMCYALIIVHLRKTRFRGDSCGSNKPTKDDRDTNRVVIMCATLVLVFVACWLPYHSVHMAKMTGIHGTSDFCGKLFYAASLMAYLNSAINPYIYFIGARFKQQLRRMRSSKAASAVMSFLTRTTRADLSSANSGSDPTSGDKTAKYTHGKDNNENDTRVRESGV
uniref:C-X-C chemokine receptor type 4-like n=1 Tax=Styela clava TaxID=7725 RepID=UPI001939E3C8|nr:C-X-C chemokine receptor type 4-like [Styela clava]